MTIVVKATITGADRTADEFKQARRDVYRRARTGIKRAGERAILPRARRGTAAGSPVDAGQVVVKTTGSYGYLTCRTVKAGRIVGLLNFGGTVAGPIIPRGRRLKSGRGKKAIAFGGIVVSQVTTARKFHGKHFLERARDAGFPLYEQVLLEEVMSAFDPLDHAP